VLLMRMDIRNGSVHDPCFYVTRSYAAFCHRNERKLMPLVQRTASRSYECIRAESDEFRITYIYLLRSAYGPRETAPSISAIVISPPTTRSSFYSSCLISASHTPHFHAVRNFIEAFRTISPSINPFIGHIRVSYAHRSSAGS